MTLKIVKGRAEETIIWSPWTCVDRQAPNLNTFRQIVLDCITAWATQFPSILIGVSGGLDSSIVALGVRHHAELHAFTIATGDPRGDERSFRSEEHTSALQSLMRRSFAVFCMKKKNT